MAFRYNDVDYGYNKVFTGIGAIIQGRRSYDIEIEHGWENAHPCRPLYCRTICRSANLNEKTLSSLLKTSKRC